MEDKIVRCPFVPAELDLPDGNLGEKLFEGLHTSASDALLDVINDVTVSRRELLERAEAVAASLVLRGCRSGDVIAIFAHNSVEWVVMLAAALRIDAVPTGIDAFLTADGAAYQLKLSQPKFLCAESSLVSVALEAISMIDGGKEIQLIVSGGECPKGCVSLDSPQSLDGAEARRLLEAAASERGPQRGPHDSCLIMFSSGTTGPRKAVLLSHQNVLMQLLCLSHQDSFSNAIVFTPFVHVSGVLVILGCLIYGQCLNFFAKFDFRRYLKLLSDKKIQRIGAITPVATLLAVSPLVKEFEINLKYLTCGGTPLGAIEDQLKLRFPGIICRQSYGMTETFGASLIFPMTSQASKPLSVGVPMFNTAAKVIDSKGERLGANERGEICIKSPCVMIGYKGNEKATAEALKDGWLHTGDFGYYDSDGYFYIIDRVSLMIKYDKYLISPSELETILLCHPAVDDAAVVGVPDPTAGELPFACVVLRADMRASSEEILQFVAEKVDPYKQLRGGVKFVKSIPKTSGGKINRGELKMLLSQGRI